jgi:Tol biopolymer transport system component
MDNPSPDSRWLPYIDFNTQTLHFIDTSKSSVCDFPLRINYTGPDPFTVWLPDGRVVVQAANGVETGLPCATFSPATPSEILILAHSDPSFSPDGRYQVVEQPYQGASQGVNEKIDLKDVATGKNLVETVFMKVARGGGNLDGYWLDASHFLIPATVDQGPLLLTPGKSAIKIATDIFHLPLKPGSGEYNFWEAITSVAKNAAQFHLMIFASSGTANPLQIYHSETGQVETLPYLASQGGFSNDGHSLLVTTPNDLGQVNTFIRSIDPPGGAFQPFSDKELPPPLSSPNGSMYYQVSQDLTTISVYTTPDSTFLGAWQAPDYELWPSWSPDGKYLAVWGRKHLDYNQESIFVIVMPVQK